MHRLFYESVDLDRDAVLRKRDDWQQVLLAEESLRILICHAGDPLFAFPEDMDAHELVVLGAPAVPHLDVDLYGGEWIYLGRDANGPVIAVDIAIVVEDREDAVRKLGGGFGDMRTRMACLSIDEAGLAAQARAIFHWHRGHRFCGACGHPNAVAEAGYRLQCTNPACGKPHFPRTDPAVIMLIHHQDHVLLARSPQFLPGMVSVLAGFVEPGETLEQAVAREVYEEVGVKIKRAQYVKKRNKRKRKHEERKNKILVYVIKWKLKHEKIIAKKSNKQKTRKSPKIRITRLKLQKDKNKRSKPIITRRNEL